MPEPRRIEFLPLDDIQGHPENPKDHDLDLLDASFDRFDFTEPPLIDERTGLLAAGHGRIERLRQRRDAGAPAPEGVVVAGDGTWLVPVVRGWASKNDDEARAYLIASNKTTEAGGWDNEALAAILADLRTDDLLEGTGYSTADVDLLLADLADSPTPGSNIDDHWVAMPEFESNNLSAAYKSTIHFATVEDADRFWEEVMGETTRHRYGFWPNTDGHVGSDSDTAYVLDTAASTDE